MRKLITFLTLISVITGCRNDWSREVVSRAEYETVRDTTTFPLFIDGGTKIVYQVGHLTPDKGLKLYFDTIPNPQGGLQLDASVRKKLSAD